MRKAEFCEEKKVFYFYFLLERSNITNSVSFSVHINIEKY
jgi:hypothetical protein